MKLGTETASVTNWMMAGSAGAPAPEVGMGATVLMWTDRHAATVIEVKSPKRIIVQYDKATRVDGSGMSESQAYTYEPNPDGPTREYVLCKTGWREKGSGGKGAGLMLGHRAEYHDYSF